LSLDDVAKQCQLNDAGRADAKAIGDAFKSAEIPIGKSYSSRFQRAVETARADRRQGLIRHQGGRGSDRAMSDRVQVMLRHSR